MFSSTIWIWVLIGAFAGVAGRKLIGGTPPFGVIGDAVLGMIGGALGGILIGLFGDVASFIWLVGSVVTALVGAVLVIWLASFFTRKPIAG